MGKGLQQKSPQLFAPFATPLDAPLVRPKILEHLWGTQVALKGQMFTISTRGDVGTAKKESFDAINAVPLAYVPKMQSSHESAAVRNQRRSSSYEDLIAKEISRRQILKTQRREKKQEAKRALIAGTSLPSAVAIKTKRIQKTSKQLKSHQKKRSACSVVFNSKRQKGEEKTKCNSKPQKDNVIERNVVIKNKEKEEEEENHDGEQEEEDKEEEEEEDDEEEEEEQEEEDQEDEEDQEEEQEDQEEELKQETNEEDIAPSDEEEEEEKEEEDDDEFGEEEEEEEEADTIDSNHLYCDEEDDNEDVW